MAHSLHRDITVIGASAGGLSSLRALIAALPADYPAAVFVVLHVSRDTPSVLSRILDRAGALPVSEATSGAPIRPGTVTVARADLHLTLQPAQTLVVHGPRENRHRPSIDVLFRSAAVAFGPRVTGVLLSGMLDDGAAGLWAIKQRGGAAVVQDPDDAEFPDMPLRAMEVTKVDHRVPMHAMAAVLVRIANAPLGEIDVEASPNMASEVHMAAQGDSTMEQMDAIGRRVPLTCPECGGTLWEIDNGGPRYRCHTGHAYSLDSLAAEQAIQVEAALWAGLRRLEESERLARHMESFARSRRNERSAEYHAEMARSNASHAETLRRLLRDSTRPAERGAADAERATTAAGASPSYAANE